MSSLLRRFQIAEYVAEGFFDSSFMYDPIGPSVCLNGRCHNVSVMEMLQYGYLYTTKEIRNSVSFCDHLNKFLFFLEIPQAMRSLISIAILLSVVVISSVDIASAMSDEDRMIKIQASIPIISDFDLDVHDEHLGGIAALNDKL